MKKQKKLSVVLATRNEESNIEDCINSVLRIADEIVIFDEESEDKTCEIARKMGAKVYSVKHSDNFHKTKQMALEKAKYPWILQLDADERVTSELSQEILNIIDMSDEEIKTRVFPSKKAKLFQKHTQILKDKGEYREDGEVVAFLIPRLNMFLGQPLRHAGVYPDPAIRLVKKGKTRFPVKSVHENMKVSGASAWLFNDLEHHDSPTLERYLMRLNRYTDLQAQDFANAKLKLNLLNLFLYSTFIPLGNFLRIYFRHKGFKDGMRGFIWCAFSSLHFTISYYKYWATKND